MKNYLKPYTACTKVESEGYLLAGGSKDTPGAGNGGFEKGGGSKGGGTKGDGGSGDGGSSKTKTNYAPKSVTNGFFFSSNDE